MHAFVALCLAYGIVAVSASARQPTKTVFGTVVAVSLPCDQAAEWISAKPERQKFRLVRMQDRDVALSGMLAEDVPQGSLVWPIWKRPPGAEPVPLDMRNSSHIVRVIL